LKNSEKELTALSQSMLAGGGKPNPLLAIDRSQNVLADMLTDMVASYLNESHGMTPRTELFDSTKLPDENRVVKKELNTPNVTEIYESTPQIQQSPEERVDKALEVDMPDENLNKKDSIRKVCICFIFIKLFKVSFISFENGNKVKKLLNTNEFFEDTLPGSALSQSPVKMTKKDIHEKVKRTPSLFKPKVQASKENIKGNTYLVKSTYTKGPRHLL